MSEPYGGASTADKSTTSTLLSFWILTIWMKNRPKMGPWRLLMENSRAVVLIEKSIGFIRWLIRMWVGFCRRRKILHQRSTRRMVARRRSLASKMIASGTLPNKMRLSSKKSRWTSQGEEKRSKNPKAGALGPGTPAPWWFRHWTQKWKEAEKKKWRSSRPRTERRLEEKSFCFGDSWTSTWMTTHAKFGTRGRAELRLNQVVKSFIEIVLARRL